MKRRERHRVRMLGEWRSHKPADVIVVDGLRVRDLIGRGLAEEIETRQDAAEVSTDADQPATDYGADG